MQKKYNINLEMSYLCLIIVPSNINDMKTVSRKRDGTKWYSYKQLTTSKNGVAWKIYINKYMKVLKNWKGHKPSEFEFLINISTGEIQEVRNVQILSDIFFL